MTLESLQQATSLSYSDLSEALVCLTAEGQDILRPGVMGVAQQLGGGKEAKRATVAAWGKTEQGDFVSVERFRRSCGFRLNEEFVQSIGTGR